MRVIRAGKDFVKCSMAFIPFFSVPYGLAKAVPVLYLSDYRGFFLLAGPLVTRSIEAKYRFFCCCRFSAE